MPNYLRHVLASLFFIYILSGCKETIDGSVTFQPGLIEVTSKDFLIPEKLKKHIDDQYLEYIKKENPTLVFTDSELLGQAGREFLNVQIYFKASADGVLSGHTKFSLPRGGGEIDLKNYVKGSKGSFFMKVTAQRTSSPEEEVKDFHVYYLSDGKVRRIAGESFGSGCNKFMDITNLIKKSNAEEGLRLNATEQRYLSVLAGVFYFVEFSPKQKRYISAVRVTDSRYPEFLCENKSEL